MDAEEELLAQDEQRLRLRRERLNKTKELNARHEQLDTELTELREEHAVRRKELHALKAEYVAKLEEHNQIGEDLEALKIEKESYMLGTYGGSAAVRIKNENAEECNTAPAAALPGPVAPVAVMRSPPKPNAKHSSSQNRPETPSKPRFSPASVLSPAQLTTQTRSPTRPKTPVRADAATRLAFRTPNGSPSGGLGGNSDTIHVTPTNKRKISTPGSNSQSITPAKQSQNITPDSTGHAKRHNSLNTTQTDAGKLYGRARYCNTPLSEAYPSVALLDGKWTEISCAVCGANSSQDADNRPVKVFRGPLGLNSHIKVHARGGYKPTIVDGVACFSRRVFSNEDVGLIEAGYEPKTKIEMRVRGPEDQSLIERYLSGPSTVAAGISRDPSASSSFGNAAPRGGSLYQNEGDEKEVPLAKRQRSF